MKIEITAEPKETAALVAELQGRRESNIVPLKIDASRLAACISKALSDENKRIAPHI